MTYTFWKLVHFIAIFVVITGLGATASHMLQGGTRENFKNRKFFMLLHGLGLAVAFVAGFGLIAKAGYNLTSGWLIAKMGLWLVLGMFPVIFFKKGSTKGPLFGLLGVLALIVFLVEYKPF